jgi:putative transposase
MSRYKITDQHGLNFVTLTVVDWVDVFIRKSYKDIIIDSLKHCQKEKGLRVYAYVIMSSHIHLILEATKPEITLSDILRDFKKFTAKKILHEIEHSGTESRKEWMLFRFAYRGSEEADRKYQFWQNDNHPIELYTLPVIAQKINYFHLNPVKEGWVAEAEHYLYSSASNYADKPGLLDVSVVDLPMSWIGYVPSVRL